MTRARTLADIADLNIDSNTLVIDTSNNRVGIGTSSPDRSLHVAGTEPSIVFEKTNEATDLKTFRIFMNSSSLQIGTVDDAFSAGQNALEITRDNTDNITGIQFKTGASSERMRINSSGNVGIGTASPSYRVHAVESSGSGIAGYFHNSAGSGNGTALIVKGGANNAGANFQVQDYNGNADFTVSGDGHASFSGSIKAADGSESAPSIVFNNDTNTGIYRKGGDKLGFVTGGVERMRITDLGRIEFEVPTNQTGSLQDQRIDWRNENNAGIMASIAVYREADGNAPASLVFRTSTNVDSASNSSDGEISEKMRINSNGTIISQNVGSTSANLEINGASTNGHYNIIMNGDSGNGYKIAFKHGSSVVGKILTNSTTTFYHTSSDYRLKENVTNMTGAIDRVKALLPKRFNFIVDPDNTVDGFLAHEAQTVVPEAVTGTKNEVDNDGNAVMQGIDQSKLVPLLTAALQEAIARIEALEAAK